MRRAEADGLAVLDGDIDAFIEAGIRWRHEQRRAAAEEADA